MAGIGFELRKIYEEEKVFSKQRAYGYVSMIYLGPLLMGILLLIELVFFSHLAGFSIGDRDGMLTVVSYSIFLSLLTTSFFSLIVTRQLSDLLYEEQWDQVLSSFYGSTFFLSVLSTVVSLIFLLFAGLTLLQSCLVWLLIGCLSLSWNAINYLTAIKDYGAVARAYAIAFVGQTVVAYLSFFIKEPTILIAAITVAYVLLATFLIAILNRTFPKGKDFDFTFLTLYDRFPNLFWTGIFLFIGLFSHIVLAWFSPISRAAIGHLRIAPTYDVAMMLAFLTTLISTINFVISLEVRFYPPFSEYLSLFKEGGNIGDIDRTEKKMISILQDEMKYLSWKQLVGSLVCMFGAPLLFYMLPLGFNGQMQGYFQTLCIAYGIFGIGNAFLLILLFFGDYVGAKRATLAFALTSTVASIIVLFLDRSFYGFGFVLGAIALILTAVSQLDRCLNELGYRMVGQQPLQEQEYQGKWSQLAEKMEGMLDDEG